jgi:type I restriction enzyme S subunit
LSDIYTFDCEAVLTSGDGAGVGKIFHLVNGKFHAHQRVYVLKDFHRISPEYFYYYFAAFFKKMALDGSAKSTVDSVRRDMIMSMPVLVPPLRDQEMIILSLKDSRLTHEQVVTLYESATALLEERKRSLITAAVTGQFDVSSARAVGFSAANA